MATPEHLLAKSRKLRDVTLEDHSFDAAAAAEELFCLEQRWGRAWCRFFKLLTPEQREAFLLNLRVACLFHDLGKANADFLAMVSGRVVEQAIRHEHLSAALLHLPSVRAWLRTSPLLDVEVLTAAVLSHHLKAGRALDGEWGRYGWGSLSQPKARVELFLGHPEVQRVLERVREVAGLSAFTETLPKEPLARDVDVWDRAFNDGRRAADSFGLASKRDPARRALLLAVKAGLVAADSAASALVRTPGVATDDEDPRALSASEVRARVRLWIRERAWSAPLTAEELQEKILAPRGRELERVLGKPFELRGFQRAMAEKPSRSLLVSACGSGKTLAAWNWARAQLAQREVGRVVFLYPTRGTATEGFRDYVAWAPEADAALVHGTAQYALAGIAANPEDTRAAKGKEFFSEEDARLFGLAFWSRRFFSATVDQFLGFLANQYASLCLLPALADSVVIVDEVHSFDPSMHRALVTLLEHFDVPVLAMTATLPRSRAEELAQRLSVVRFEKPEEREELDRLEEHPRYQLLRVDGEAQALGLAERAWGEEQRVLWVVNTVDRARKLARALRKRLPDAEVHCYHSRFKLQDREQRHKAVVAAFTPSAGGAPRPVIAVTTQVCEMSLDLDADLLLTEVAPPSSLVQRFGRANRHLRRGLDFLATLAVYEPERALPYAKEDLAAGRRFLDSLGADPRSQRAMAEVLEATSRDEMATDAWSAFTSGGYYALPAAFRDTDEHSVPGLLADEVAAYLAAPKDKQPGFVVPVPGNVPSESAEEVHKNRALRGMRLVARALYDEALGLGKAEDEEVPQ